MKDKIESAKTLNRIRMKWNWSASQFDRLSVKVSVADPDVYTGPKFSIPDPGSKRFRIRTEELKYFWPLKLFLSSRKNYLGCSSQISVFSHPGSRYRVKKAPDPGSESATLVKVRQPKWQSLCIYTDSLFKVFEVVKVFEAIKICKFAVRFYCMWGEIAYL
jgi:hypothetical protein